MTRLTDLSGWPAASRRAFEAAYLGAAQNVGRVVIVKAEGDHLVVALQKENTTKEMQDVTTTTDYYAADKGLSAADADRVRGAAKALLGSSDPRVEGLYGKCLGLLSGPMSDDADESDALLAKAAELRKADANLSQYDALIRASKDRTVTASARARTEALAKSGGYMPVPAETVARLGYDPNNPSPSPEHIARMKNAR